MEDHDEEHELSLTFYRVPIHNMLTHKSLPMKSNILSLILNMLIRRVYVILKFFIEGEGEDEPSLGEQRISEGVEEKKNFQYLKFSGGLSGGILCAICNNQI
jgi:hypothetical protein